MIVNNETLAAMLKQTGLPDSIRGVAAEVEFEDPETAAIMDDVLVDMADLLIHLGVWEVPS